MSTPASLSGAATSRTASVVSSPNGSGPSISGTSRGHGTAIDLDPGVVRVDELLVAAARARSPPSRAGRRGGCGSRARRRAPRAGARRRRARRARAAGRAGRAAVAVLQATTTSFSVLGLEMAADLEREAAAPRRAGAGRRAARVVAEVDRVLVRQRDEQLVEDGEAAHAGVEDADRPPVHRADDTDGRSCGLHTCGLPFAAVTGSRRRTLVALLATVAALCRRGARRRVLPAGRDDRLDRRDRARGDAHAPGRAPPRRAAGRP